MSAPKKIAKALIGGNWSFYLTIYILFLVNSFVIRKLNGTVASVKSMVEVLNKAGKI
jgi:hypothetical protein